MLSSLAPQQPPSKHRSKVHDLINLPHDTPRAVPDSTVAMPNSSQPPPPASQDIYWENGRGYCAFRKGLYLYPCDETEKSRMDVFHNLFLIARHQDLHRVKIKNSKDTRILDVGTGTGIWAIDMADKYPDAEVVGIDLANIQPRRIPKNLTFNVGVDYQNPWSFGEDSWDLIHIRQGLGSVVNWPALYQKIFRHLHPGTGSIEQVEIDLQPRCDDGTLPQTPVVQWYDYLKQATEVNGRPIEYQHNTKQMLENAGFIDINEEVIRAPFNTWPTDRHQKEIGRWYCAGLMEWVEALSLAPMTRAFPEWTPADVRRLVGAVLHAILSKKAHAYNNIHIWTARRPG